MAPVDPRRQNGGPTGANQPPAPTPPLAAVPPATPQAIPVPPTAIPSPPHPNTPLPTAQPVGGQSVLPQPPAIPVTPGNYPPAGNPPTAIPVPSAGQPYPAAPPGLPAAQPIPAAQPPNVNSGHHPLPGQVAVPGQIAVPGQVAVPAPSPLATPGQAAVPVQFAQPIAQPIAQQTWPGVAPGAVPSGAVPVTSSPLTSHPAQPYPAQPYPAQPVYPNRPIPVQPGQVPPATDGAGENTDEDEDEDAPLESADKAIKAAPPWLVSLVIHMVALIALGLSFLSPVLHKAIFMEASMMEDEGQQLQNETLEMPSLETPVALTEPVFSNDLAPVEDPLAAPPTVVDPVLAATSSSSDMEAPSVGIALNGRQKGMKKALLAAYGGNGKTEAAVLMGLEWLAKNQQADGSWSLRGPYSDGGSTNNPIAATAMALLAFQGAGHTHQSGEFKANVTRGWGYLLKQETREGDFTTSKLGHARLYSQGQATIAICELYGMTQDSRFREPAQAAINFAVSAQAVNGGWRYRPGQEGDTSVTGWFVMAMQSALMAELDVPSETLDGISDFLDAVAQDSGAFYGYTGPAKSLTLTAEGLLCRQYLGWKRDDTALNRGADYVAQNPIKWDSSKNVYYWYYATQVLHHLEGERWEKWNNVMRVVVPQNQVTSGAEKGSWEPSGDRYGNHGGRLYVTCLCIYMLEVYYRHLPIYRYKEFF